MAAATASQAWAILSRHARDEISSLRLQELCHDNDRVSSLVAVHNTSSSRGGGGGGSGSRSSNSYQSGGSRRGGGGGGGGGGSRSTEDYGGDDGDTDGVITTSTAAGGGGGGGAGMNENYILIVDLSRQRMTLDTLNHLLRLASARGVRGFVQTLAWGQNDRNNPIVPVGMRNIGGRQHLGVQQHRIRLGVRGAGRDFMTANEDGAAGDGSTIPAVPPSQSMKKARFHHYESGFDGGPGGVGTGASAMFKRQQQQHYYVTSPSMHLALRAPADCGLEMLTSDGVNALDGIHREWRRIERLSESLRKGQLRGATGSMIRDVVVVGRGVPVAALKFLYEALTRDEVAGRAAMEGLGFESSGRSAGSRSGRTSSTSSYTPPGSRGMRFISSVDPISAASAVSDLNPATTVVVTLALRGDEETIAATRVVRSWLIHGLGSHKRPDLVVNKHMLLVTGNEKLKTSKPETVFLIPDHSRCEAFTTFSAAGLVPLSIVFGWKIVEKILAGAHDMDNHFVETNPRHNLPILLSLADVWNDAFLGSSGRVVTPFSESFSAYPTFVAALEAQTCGNRHSRRNKRLFGRMVGKNRDCASAVVVDGATNGDYDRALYQGGRVVPSELVMALDAQASANTMRMMGLDGTEDILANQDELICSFFAHADVLAFGSGSNAAGGGGGRPNGLVTADSFASNSSDFPVMTTTTTAVDEDMAEGNRPSTLVICGRCDAFACGQLVALAEHRAVVTARLWDVDPFAKTVGASLRSERTAVLKENLLRMYEKIAITGSSADDDDQGEDSDVNLATSTILGHYANLMRDKRMYVVRGS